MPLSFKQLCLLVEAVPPPPPKLATNQPPQAPGMQLNQPGAPMAGPGGMDQLGGIGMGADSLGGPPGGMMGGPGGGGPGDMGNPMGGGGPGGAMMPGQPLPSYKIKTQAGVWDKLGDLARKLKGNNPTKPQPTQQPAPFKPQSLRT